MCSNAGSGGGGSGASREPVTTAAQNKAIDSIARKTRDLKNEQYRIVNENGEVVIVKRGGRDQVAITVGEKREHMPGAVSIHNHPDGGTFSAEDLRDFGFGAKQIAVASPEGTYRLTRRSKNASWLDMQKAMENAGLTQDRSYTDLKRQAEKSPKLAKLAQKVSSTSKQWVDARSAGKSKEQLDIIGDKIKKLQDQYKTALKAEIRKVETKPFDDFYKKNAKKYGFDYSFAKR